jgi:hypothetical protein
MKEKCLGYLVCDGKKILSCKMTEIQSKEVKSAEKCIHLPRMSLCGIGYDGKFLCNGTESAGGTVSSHRKMIDSPSHPTS